MSKELAIFATLIAYLAVLLIIGLASRSRTGNSDDYFLGGRGLGPIVASISASASSSSAWTLLGVSGFAFTFGVSALWLIPGCVGGFVLIWCVMARRLREVSHGTGALTLTDVLVVGNERQRRAIRMLASTIILLALTSYVASQFQAAGITLGETFGIPPSFAILIGSGIVVFYTFVGGFWAVSLTDTLQGLLMALAAVVLPLAALAAVGPGNLIPRLAEVPVDGYLSLWQGMPLSAGVGFAAGLLGIGLGYSGQPHVLNRFMALRQGEVALTTARRVAIAWAVIVYSGMVLLGLCARVAFPAIVDGERAFMHVAGELFPPVLAGVIIAAILSAVMSTADSQLLVAASSVTHDLKLGAGSRFSELVRSRAVVVLLSAGAVAAALLVQESIFSRVLFAWSAMGAAFGPLTLAIVLRGRVDPRYTLGAMLVGFLLSVGAYTARLWGFGGAWAGFNERVLPFAVSGLLAWLGSRGPNPQDTGDGA